MRQDWRSLGLITAVVAVGSALTSAQSVGVVPTESSGPQISFHYENPQLQPAEYSFVVHEDGSGHFQSTPGATLLPDSSQYRPLAEPQERAIQLSPAMAESLFATARAQKLFAKGCDEPKTRVAFQGTKQLGYQGPDGEGSCTYNWSKAIPIQKLTSTFEGIAFTLEEGRRLVLEHKHDRLSLDAEMQVLFQAAKDGRALELQTIQPVLLEIIGDEAVMERARSRARKLLDDTNTTASLR